MPCNACRAEPPRSRAYEAFIEQGEALNPQPAQLQQALRNARRRIGEVRDRMRRGGDETYS